MKLAWQQIPSVVVSDLLCQINLDGIVLDTEHGCFNNETLYNCIQLITASGKKCFVRLTEVNKTLVRICLDCGANGLIFSTLETEEQAAKVQDICKFPKFKGTRGLGLVRQNGWGEKDLISEPPILVAQIETMKAIKNLDNIKKYNFDYYMIGPYDLSASIGFPGQFDSEEYLAAINKIKHAIPNEKLAVHIPKDVQKEIKKYHSYGIIAVGMDTTLLLEGYKQCVC